MILGGLAHRWGHSKVQGAGRRGKRTEEKDEDHQEKNLGSGWMNWVKIEVGREETLELTSADASVLSSGSCKEKQ